LLDERHPQLALAANHDDRSARRGPEMIHDAERLTRRRLRRQAFQVSPVMLPRRWRRQTAAPYAELPPDAHARLLGRVDTFDLAEHAFGSHSAVFQLQIGPAVDRIARTADQ